MMRDCRRSCGRFILGAAFIWAAVAFLARADALPPMPMSALRLGQHAAESGAIVPEIGKVTEDSRWFILLAGVNVYPKLESERLIREYFDPAMKLLSPGYDRVTIISDLRDRHLLWPPHFGVGYTLGKHFSAFVQGGYSAGKVRTEQNDPSIILLPLHTDFEIKRGAGFVGLGLDYFPLGMPRKQHYEGWLERLQAARPSLGVRATWTHAFFTAKVKVGFQPVIPLVSLRLKDSWDLWSVNFNGGLDVPLTQRSVFTMNGGYNFFEGETGDFNSASFTFGWKYYFR